MKVKNPQQLTDVVNELLGWFESSTRIAELIDDTIFSEIDHHVHLGSVLSNGDSDYFYLLRQLRDMFNKLETTEIKRK